MKLKLVEKIVSIEDDHLLNEIKSLLGLSDRDFWDDMSESARSSVRKGLEESRARKTRPHDDVMAEIKARFPKK